MSSPSSDRLDRFLEQGSELLTKQILSTIHHRQGTTKATIIGNFAKGLSDTNSKRWMKEEAVFDGDTWLQLGVHERKYVLRKVLASLEETGVIRYETKKRLVGGASRVMKPGNVLDLLAHIDE